MQNRPRRNLALQTESCQRTCRLAHSPLNMVYAVSSIGDMGDSEIPSAG